MPRNTAKLKGLSLDRLETLAAVVAAGSIVKAAASDPTRQSQFSRQIKELEEWFGAELLDRRSSPNLPTEAAKTIAKDTERFLKGMEEVRKQAIGGKQTIRFGAGERMIRAYLIPWVSSFNDDNHRFVFRNQTAGTTRAELAGGRIDFGVLRRDRCPGGFETHPIKDIPMSFLMPKELAEKRSRWEWKHLEQVPLVLMEGRGGFGSFLRSKCEEHGVTIDPTFECTSWSQVMDAMGMSKAAGFLPKDLEPQAPEGFTRISLSGLADYKEDYVIAWDGKAADNRPELLELIRHIRQG